MKFDIQEEFLINGQATRLISGSIHYFRITPGKWYQSLYNLKALGGNTVETYIPWNLHEPRPGEFNFEHHADIEKFIQLATKLGLYIILRPSPYICAEWDFGGLPAWLLKDGIRIRSLDPQFTAAVDRYYAKMIPILAKYQTTRGGNILMFQVENEYGSYSDDKDYLVLQKKMMEKYGVEVPFFTSDGGWEEALEAGTLMNENVLPTVNFGSDTMRNFGALRAFMNKNGVKKPLMCMEFWNGWFNNWGEERIVRDPLKTADVLKEILLAGSVNLYMFHGGSNFNFYNGRSDDPSGNLPQIQSYDYNSPLNESGNPTAKYYAIQNVIKEIDPTIKTSKPIISETIALPTVAVQRKVSLFATLEKLAEPKEHDVTLTMEDLDQSFGYVLYQTKNPIHPTSAITKAIEAGDRLQFFLNQKLIETQYLDEVGQEFTVVPDSNKLNYLQVLVENVGRNNYGRYLVAPIQKKGIRSGVMQDLHYLSKWQHYSLPLNDSSQVDFDQDWQAGTPAFYEFEFDVTKPTDTFIYTANLGKGSLFVNGFNLGEFWEIGPYVTMYLPYDLLQVGKNRIVVFETEGHEISKLEFVSEPIVIKPTRFK